MSDSVPPKPPPIPTAELIRALASDSEEGYDPSWSQAFGQITEAPTSAPVAELEARCRAGGGGAVLPLLALRRIAPAACAAIPPKVRAAAFASGLLSAPRYNTWGLPGEPFSECEAAAVELGAHAASCFIPLLAADQPAFLGGSRIAMEARIRGIRVCDHALAIVSAMVHRPYHIAPTPVERDRDIRDLLVWLAANPGQWD